jgi:hypothetical protein
MPHTLPKRARSLLRNEEAETPQATLLQSFLKPENHRGVIDLDQTGMLTNSSNLRKRIRRVGAGA